MTSANNTSFKDDLKRRIAATKPSRWIRFSIVMILFTAWVAWLGSWWVLIFALLLFDIYITGYIPLTWWKKHKNPVVRTVMSWVDAILYALILVYFVFTFVGQNYVIPSSSLEKTLLIGDYLWVNKMAYGPRVPMTPVHFPLVQNRLPLIDTKSYTEWPSWKYRRLKGMGEVERGDIVVFNFPMGDTVATKFMESPKTYYDLIREYGRNTVKSNPEIFGDIIVVPVDRRQNYVKRAIGLPGEHLKIANDTIYINGQPLPMPENAQYNYFYQVADGGLTEKEWDDLGIARDDRMIVDIAPNEIQTAREGGFYVTPTGTVPTIYVSPLTASMVERMKSDPRVLSLIKTPPYSLDLYPADTDMGWTLSDFGEIWIPRKGATLHLTDANWPIYERVIRSYEGNTDAEWKDGQLWIDGIPSDRYTFAMDYYFMMGDNRDNSSDSRFWGFVPEDHIVGKPWRVLVSFDKDRGLFDGKIRFDRILSNPNPDHEAFTSAKADR